MLSYDTERNTVVAGNGSDVKVFGDGDGDYLFALNGNQLGNHQWGDFLSKLSRALERPVVAIDPRPAVVRSIGRHGLHRAGIDVFVEATLSAVDDLNNHDFMPEKPDAVGNSLGGAVVLQIIKSHPEALRKGVGVSSPTERPPKLQTYDPVTIGMQAFRWAMGDMRIDPHIASRTLGETPDKHDELRQKYDILNGTTYSTSDLTQTLAYADFSTRNMPLQALALNPFLPVPPPPENYLAINGSEDKLTPPGRHSIVVEGASHMLPFTHPDETIEKIEEFLRRP